MNKIIVDPSRVEFAWNEIKDKKYKYEVVSPYTTLVNTHPPVSFNNDFFSLHKSGLLIIREGYRWDGASGPMIDTISTMRASCVHDALYQMIRMGGIPKNMKAKADEEFARILKEDYHPTNKFSQAWSHFRAAYAHTAVKIFGGLFLG